MKMHRNIFSDIVSWNNRPKRKPLILMGARQVGKTWLMNEFAQSYYPHATVRIDLQRNELLCNQLEHSYLDPQSVINLIQAATGERIEAGRTLLIIDEIQESPSTLNSLKFFNEEMPDLTILVAGSLLGLSVGKSPAKRNEKPKSSFPVGKVNFLDVPPLTFTEFVRAVGNDLQAEALENADWTVLDALREKYTLLLKQYLFVGGMPEAVVEFADSGDYAAVRKIQSEILQSYDTDFVKHAPPELLGKIRLLWHNIPAQLAKENKKFLYSALKTGARAREYESALQWLDDAGMLHQTFRVSPPRMPLASYQDFSAFKLYAHDVGLLSAIAELPSTALIDGNALFSNFNGSLTEQYVLQEIVAVGASPHYWSADSGNAEVEFVVQGENAIFPIEAKAGINTKAKSLKVYRELFHPPFALRTSLQPFHNGDTTKDIPLYAFGPYLNHLLSAPPELNYANNPVNPVNPVKISDAVLD